MKCAQGSFSATSFRLVPGDSGARLRHEQVRSVTLLPVMSSARNVSARSTDAPTDRPTGALRRPARLGGAILGDLPRCLRHLLRAFERRGSPGVLRTEHDKADRDDHDPGTRYDQHHDSGQHENASRDRNRDPLRIPNEEPDHFCGMRCHGFQDTDSRGPHRRRPQAGDRDRPLDYDT